MFVNRSDLLPLFALMGVACGMATALAEETSGQAASSRKPPATVSLPEVIEAVQREEARFTRYSASVRHVFVYSPTSKSSTETVSDIIVDGPLFKVTGRDTIQLTPEETLHSHRQTVFNGTNTVAIEDDNCRTSYAGRSAPPQLSAPHCWALFQHRIPVPLSVLLSGTDAVRQYQADHGFTVGDRPLFPFLSITATMVSSEQIDQLDCEIVRIDRQIMEKSTQQLYLWLARNRNWHIARAQVYMVNDGQRDFGIPTEVLKWRKVAPDVWVPRLLEASLTQPNGQGTPCGRLMIESAELNPEITPETFALPVAPVELPQFSVDDERRLIDSPHHPVSPTRPGSTEVWKILDRLTAEEQKYDPLEMELISRQDSLNPRMQSMAGEIFETRDIVIRSGKQSYRERSFSRLNPPGTFAFQQARPVAAEDYSFPLEYSRDAYDGQIHRRFVARRSMGDEAFTNSAKAQFQTTAPKDRLQVAHSFLFRELTPRTSLSNFLRAGFHDEETNVRLEVTYEGDDQIDGLVCHKLLCQLPKPYRAPPHNYFVLWLARDRNLMPIRRQWHQSSIHPTLPNIIAYSEDLRELAPGVWFPHKSSQLTFQKDGDDSLQTNRLMLQNRIDTIVKEVNLQADIAPGRFSELIVPQDVTVDVIEPDRPQWKFTQAKGGRLEVDLQRRPRDKVR